MLHPAGRLALVGPVCGDWFPSGDGGIRHWSQPFPVGQLAQEARDAARVTMTAPKPVAVICDDCPHTRTLFSTVAASVGFEPVCTDNGLDVAPLIESCGACVVLLDILMPLHDGLETMRIIRESRLEVEVIALTGGFSLYLEVAGRLGARHTLAKPVHVETLRQILWSIARRQEPRLNASESHQRTQ
jgi:DNA-binding response OmpR family regulator